MTGPVARMILDGDGLGPVARRFMPAPLEDLPAADVVLVNRLGRVMAGCGRQVAEHWTSIRDHDVLAPVAESLSRVLDVLLDGGDAESARWALDQLAEAERALPLVDADIAGPHRGGEPR
jgi:hypothetical protein